MMYQNQLGENDVEVVQIERWKETHFVLNPSSGSQQMKTVLDDQMLSIFSADLLLLLISTTET